MDWPVTTLQCQAPTGWPVTALRCQTPTGCCELIALLISTADFSDIFYIVLFSIVLWWEHISTHIAKKARKTCSATLEIITADLNLPKLGQINLLCRISFNTVTRNGVRSGILLFVMWNMIWFILLILLIG